jgi:hypothetical protein
MKLTKHPPAIVRTNSVVLTELVDCVLSSRRSGNDPETGS